MGTESSDVGSTARRMVLGGQLRRLREARGVSRPEAGYEIRASESKISRLELGRVTFKERDVADLLSLYGVTEEEEREPFLDLVRQSNQPGWWHTYSDTLYRWFQDYLGLEESASRIQFVRTEFVPGLLQTEEYTRGVVRLGLPDVPPDQVERRVAIRRERQRILARPNAPRIWALIDEGVLYRRVGDKEVMRQQWLHLLDLTKLPTVSLQVIPFDTGGGGAEGSFSLLRFAEPELPDVAYLEHLSGALYLDKRTEVDLYAKVFHRLVATAATPDESRRMLSRLVQET